ncbi:MAG TPA: DNA mismatch repair endonuclease MutL, partial [Longilinea sp.]|nr:DNA mismatch repair endonuclease MutL [Longilinea sp.]
MMIHILPDDVVSQIAAGEVVERPASVVKELMENAVDAGATHIQIRIEGAGKRLIEIGDDGSGIEPADLNLAVTRHATSKLTKADDLFHMRTLGFRGEALASVGSVARLTLTSRSTDSQQAARIIVDGGSVSAMDAVGGPIGTIVKVEDLFFNVPARLKFLKQDVTERNLVDALLSRYAMAYPNIAFHYIAEGKTILQTSGSGDNREVFAQVYGVDLARQMLAIEFEEEGVTIKGLTSPISVTRSNRKEITFFVNGRWVQDVALNTALIQAYHTLLMVGRYPLAVLFLTLSPEEVDVNVHPAKSEVRFRSPDRLFSAVSRSVKRTLLAYSPTPALTPTTWSQAPIRSEPAWDFSAESNRIEVPAIPSEPFSPSTYNPQNQPVELPSGAIPLMRLIGQIGGTYIVAEGPDGLYLIDQHAAHERVLFEQIHHQIETKIPSQTLLTPVLFQTNPQGAALLQQQLDVLDKLGFHLELFGPNTFRIFSIPVLFQKGDPIAAVRSVIE